MSATTVQIQGISPQTTEKEVRDFFSFCGKITTLSVTPSSDSAEASQSATVTFEKETAAKTALLLDNTQLGSSQVKVSSTQSLDDIAGSKAAASGDENPDDIPQEDKPRSRIVAEYLAHGYTLSDTAIQHAIALDNKHGVSQRFTSALSNFDEKYHASERAKSVDQSYGISDKANVGWRSLNSYFEKALDNPTGQKVRSFYTDTQKQVLDVHQEALRLREMKAGKSTSNRGSSEEEEHARLVEEKQMESVEGTDKTKCQCGGVSGQCPCTNCACEGCAKNH